MSLHHVNQRIDCAVDGGSREYELKHAKVTVSPPLDRQDHVVKSGDFIRFEVELDPKTTYDKLQLCLTGRCYVSGEPPILHNFVKVDAILLPESERSNGVQRIGSKLAWSITMPSTTNCACHSPQRALPSKFNHPNVRVQYQFELVGRRQARFGFRGTERLTIPFVVENPPERHPTPALAFDPVRHLTQEELYESAVQTVRSTPSMPITAAQLSYVVMAPVSTTTFALEVKYRVRLAISPSFSQDRHELVKALAQTLNVSISRKLAVRKPGSSQSWTTPSLCITQRLNKRSSRIVTWKGYSDRALEFAGTIEVPRSELHALDVCNAQISFSMRASFGTVDKCGKPVSIVVHDLDVVPRSAQRLHEGTRASVELADNKPLPETPVRAVSPPTSARSLTVPVSAPQSWYG
ncbi:hypothetical protein ACM66B_004700 [Microbotryomycetes sp. NB124-2]